MMFLRKKKNYHDVLRVQVIYARDMVFRNQTQIFCTKYPIKYNLNTCNVKIGEKERKDISRKLYIDFKVVNHTLILFNK